MSKKPIYQWFQRYSNHYPLNQIIIDYFRYIEYLIIPTKSITNQIIGSDLKINLQTECNFYHQLIISVNSIIKLQMIMDMIEIYQEIFIGIQQIFPDINKYIEYLVDGLCDLLQIIHIYNTPNPYPVTDLIRTQSTVYETTNDEYKLSTEQTLINQIKSFFAATDTIVNNSLNSYKYEFI